MILSETITHVLKLLAQSTTQRIFFARKKVYKASKKILGKCGQMKKDLSEEIVNIQSGSMA